LEGCENLFSPVLLASFSFGREKKQLENSTLLGSMPNGQS
jgi:hypothetical protein